MSFKALLFASVMSIVLAKAAHAQTQAIRPRTDSLPPRVLTPNSRVQEFASFDFLIPREYRCTLVELRVPALRCLGGSTHVLVSELMFGERLAQARLTRRLQQALQTTLPRQLMQRNPEIQITAEEWDFQDLLPHMDMIVRDQEGRYLLRFSCGLVDGRLLLVESISGDFLEDEYFIKVFFTTLRSRAAW